VDGKIYVGTGDGDVHVFAHGREKKVIGKIEMEDTIYSTPAAANGVLYVMTMKKLYAVKGMAP
jgi:sugar lactone lactonase YvrE